MSPNGNSREKSSVTFEGMRDELDRTLKNYAKNESLKDLEVRLMKWMIGSMATAATLATGLAVLIARLIDS